MSNNNGEPTFLALDTYHPIGKVKYGAKADTKTHTDLCQEAQAGGGKAVTVDDIVAVTGTVLFSAGSQAEEVVTLQQIAEYLAENPLYSTPPATVVNKQLLEALQALRVYPYCGCYSEITDPGGDYLPYDAVVKLLEFGVN